MTWPSPASWQRIPIKVHLESSKIGIHPRRLPEEGLAECRDFQFPISQCDRLTMAVCELLLADVTLVGDKDATSTFCLLSRSLSEQNGEHRRDRCTPKSQGVNLYIRSEKGDMASQPVSWPDRRRLWAFVRCSVMTSMLPAAAVYDGGELRLCFSCRAVKVSSGVQMQEDAGHNCISTTRYCFHWRLGWADRLS